jgi:hypothetical protein
MPKALLDALLSKQMANIHNASDSTNKKISDSLAHIVTPNAIDPVDFDENEIELPLYIEWRTPTTWATPPTSVSHNIVFYCTRGYSAP